MDEWLARCPVYNTLLRAAEVKLSHKLMGEGTALLKIGFSFDLPVDELQTELSPLAEQFAATEGLLWKIWGLDEENSHFSGLLLFENTASMQAFLAGELAAYMMDHSALSDFEVKPYTIMAT